MARSSGDRLGRTLSAIDRLIWQTGSAPVIAHIVKPQSYEPGVTPYTMRIAQITGSFNQREVFSQGAIFPVSSCVSATLTSHRDLNYQQAREAWRPQANFRLKLDELSRYDMLQNAAGRTRIIGYGNEPQILIGKTIIRCLFRLSEEEWCAQTARQVTSPKWADAYGIEHAKKTERVDPCFKALAEMVPGLHTER